MDGTLQRCRACARVLAGSLLGKPLLGIPPPWSIPGGALVIGSPSFPSCAGPPVSLYGVALPLLAVDIAQST
jgi:hypothetical protein